MVVSFTDFLMENPQLMYMTESPVNTMMINARNALFLILFPTQIHSITMLDKALKRMY